MSKHTPLGHVGDSPIERYAGEMCRYTIDSGASATSSSGCT
jgi:hypothetical protein